MSLEEYINFDADFNEEDMGPSIAMESDLSLTSSPEFSWTYDSPPPFVGDAISPQSNQSDPNYISSLDINLENLISTHLMSIPHVLVPQSSLLAHQYLMAISPTYVECGSQLHVLLPSGPQASYNPVDIASESAIDNEVMSNIVPKTGMQDTSSSPSSSGSPISSGDSEISLGTPKSLPCTPVSRVVIKREPEVESDEEMDELKSDTSDEDYRADDSMFSEEEEEEEEESVELSPRKTTARSPPRRPSNLATEEGKVVCGQTVSFIGKTSWYTEKGISPPMNVGDLCKMTFRPGEWGRHLSTCDWHVKVPKTLCPDCHKPLGHRADSRARHKRGCKSKPKGSSEEVVERRVRRPKAVKGKGRPLRKS